MSILIEIDFAYDRILTKEETEKLSEYSVTEVKFREEEGEEGYRLAWGNGPLISVALAAEFAPFEVKRCIDNASTQKLAEFGNRITTVVNEKCSVAVSGLGLLTINDVRLELDCCTDNLAELLGLGWRIVAVCVQPDQRRPDYILGRTTD